MATAAAEAPMDEETAVAAARFSAIRRSSSWNM
jgi:hypothetical protein